MGNIHYAARDPIFFLHHANIDRLLEVWLKIDPATHKAPDSFPAWNPAVYRFPTSGGGVETPSVQDLALGSMEAMGYTYADTNPPSVSAPTVPARPANLQAVPIAPPVPAMPRIQLFAAIRMSGSTAIQVGAAGTMDLAVEPSHQQTILALADKPAGQTNAGGLTIVLENVRIKEPAPGVLGYNVFINLPKETGSSDFFKDYYVGTISLFALQHMSASGGKTLKFRISRTHGSAGIRKSFAAGVTSAHVSVSLIPELAPDATVPKKPVLSIDEIRLEGANSQ